MELWCRVAPLLTPWFSWRGAIGNLNQYAGWGTSIPWHSDTEPLFGDQNDPKVIASMSLGSSGCVVAGGETLFLLSSWTMVTF